MRSNNLGPIWPAYGVALAALLLCGNRIWPAVALGVFVVAFSSPESYLTALGQTAGSTAAALIGTFLLRRIAKFDNSLCRLRDVLALILLGALGSAIVSASIGTLALHSGNINSYAGMGSAWLIYWLGDSTGVLLVTPLLLTFPNLFRIRDWGRFSEFLCLLTILVGICAIVFGDLAIVPVRMVAFAVLPLVIWAAIRFSVSGAALSIFLVATVATVQTAIGTGSFATSTPFIDGIQLDAFFAVLSLTGLTFAAVYAERELAERQRGQSLCEQVGMEVRLQNQELLRHHEERFRLAQQAARIGTFERNLQTGVITWTSELESIYGLRPGSFGGTLSEFENLVHPEDRYELFTRLSSEAIETGQPTKGEWRAVWPDGSIHWIAGTWQAFMDESGRPLRVIGVNLDMTDRKLAEQRLREYEKAVEGVEEFIVVLDREHRCLMANREFLKRRDLRSEQVVGHLAHEFVDQEIYENVIKPKLEECFRGNVVRYELKYSYPHLGERNLFASYYPIEGKNGVDRAACILHDITDRKLAEEALRQSEEKFHNIFRDAGVGMVIVSPEGHFLAANKAFCDCLGYTEEELLEKTIESVTFPEDWPAFLQKLRESLTTEYGFQWFQKRCLHKSGRIVYTESSASVIRSREGNPQYLVGQVLNITERKEAEEAVANMSRQLIAAQEQERARIARELHDDINQRIAMLAVELEQLQDNPVEVWARLQELRKQTTDISTDIQSLSHDLHSSHLEYLGAVAGMKSWCREFGERHGMEIGYTHDVRSSLPPEIGLCLFRVLQQALSNATKHSGVQRIEVQLQEKSGEIYLTVRDAGRGFDVEAVKQGKGLGLISMRERVRLVNGEISIDSKPTSGTTIHVRVPLASGKASERSVA